VERVAAEAGEEFYGEGAVEVEHQVVEEAVFDENQDVWVYAAEAAEFVVKGYEQAAYLSFLGT
jgi:hypothetical protein